QIYSPENQGLFGAHFHWKEALNLPGAIQVGMMKQFFESLPWQTLIPDQTIIGGFNWENSAHITGMVNREKDLLLAYSPSGRTIKLNTFPEGENIIHGFWFDPEKGLLKALEQPYNNRLVVPDKKKDWILLMMSDKRAIEWKPPFPFME
ncbi:MAG: putative collagen-binding domain-containing protein, partial [Cyclobacteriaceae bacterium]